jgi:hypothetical protein
MSEPDAPQEPEAPEPETPEAEAPAAEPVPSAEDRALAMGWTPKERFKGDPEKFVDAETFIRRGEEIAPLLKAHNKRLEQTVQRAEKKIAALEKTLEKFAEHNSKTDQRAFERAAKEIQAKLDAAAEASDVQGVREATAELVEITREAAKPVAPAAPEYVEPQDMTDWKSENPWFNKDKPLTAAAIEIAYEIEVETGLKSGATFFAEVDKRLRAAFPTKFENPRRQAAQNVEGGGQARAKPGKSWADLSPEQKDAADYFVKSIPGFTREKYVKDIIG